MQVPAGSTGRDAGIKDHRHDTGIDERPEDTGVGLEEEGPQRVVLEQHALPVHQHAVQDVDQREEDLVASTEHLSTRRATATAG